MPRPIDADAIALQVRRNLIPDLDIDGTVNAADAERYFLRLLDKAPTVDAVEVVRCRECKYFYHSVSSDRDGRCVQFGTYDADPSVYLNDFCSYGKRKDGVSNDGV